MKKKILLTGGAGYIASHTFVALAEAGYDIVILDDFSNAKPSVLTRLSQLTGRNEIACYTGSVCSEKSLETIFTEHDIDAVVHFAAKKAVGESLTAPLDYFHTNIGGLIVLLQAMKKAGIMRLVFSSSATVYGTPGNNPIPETAPIGFTNPYGFTKLTSEQILMQAAQADEWVFGILRYFNPVGAHPSGLIGEDPHDTPNNLMPYIAQVAVGTLPHLNVFGDDYSTRDGTGVRDYVHVMDLADGHVASLNALFTQNKTHLVNLGTGRGSSVLELLSAYQTACGRDLVYKIVPRRAGDVAECVADPKKARTLLGFKAKRDLAEMCSSSWHWITTGTQFS